MSVSCRWFLRWSDHHNHRYLELSDGAILDTRNLQAFQRLTRMFGHHPTIFFNIIMHHHSQKSIIQRLAGVFGHHPNIVFNIIMHHHSHKSKWLTMIMNSYLDNAVSTTVADCHIDWLQLRKNNIRDMMRAKLFWKGSDDDLYMKFDSSITEHKVWLEDENNPGNQFQFSPIEPVVVKTILNFLLSCISQFSGFYQPCICWK